MNARVIALVAGPRERWPLAGDQLYLDLDLSDENLHPGTRLALAPRSSKSLPNLTRVARNSGPALVRTQLSSSIRRWGNSCTCRGVNAKVIHPGTIRVGDIAGKT